MRQFIRNSIFLLIIFSFFEYSISVAQYYSETVNEKSFEQSEIFFKSHFLNPYGLLHFREVAEGLIDDPFLRLHLNPASLPQWDTTRSYVYLDFRGDRTEAEIISIYRAVPARYIYPPSYYYDPRWFQTTRKEPEPVFSLAALTYPLRNLLIGGSYQIIHKEEEFYRVPSWIYYPMFGYDVFGVRALETGDIPIIDRFSGQDEMVNTAHLVSGYLGYRVSKKLSAGLSFNSVAQSRDGVYLNANRDEYGSTNNWDRASHRERERNQDYAHFDLSGGLRFQFTPQLSAGIKVGRLSGKVTQDFLSADSSWYRYDKDNDPNNWSRNYHRSISRQDWTHNGNTIYGRIGADYEFENGKAIQFYYQYSLNEVDLKNSSQISDTSYYKSNRTWDTTFYFSRHYSSMSDLRSGSGERQEKIHRGMLTLHWQLTPKNTIYTGIYYSRTNLQISSIEPVTVRRYSESFYYNSTWNPDTSHYLNQLIEDKTLHWQYESLNWTVQIPILAKFQFSPNWSMMLGINRILNNWEIREQTLAIFERRYRLQNGSEKEETNFGERYTQPTRKITEDFTDVISNFEVGLSERLRINLLLDPEFKDTFRIAQWWLSFRATL